MKWRKAGDARILDFDVECRASHWYGGDMVSKEITAIGWKWIGDEGSPQVALARNCSTKREWTAMQQNMLLQFVRVYDQADIVTGHYIVGFDLPLINGQLFEVDLPLLSDKRAQDTKLNLLRFNGLSKSQENICATLGIPEPKIGMDQGKWRWANRLIDEGIKEARVRVVGDVIQHEAMRAELLRRGMLKPGPTLWNSSGSSFGVDYTP